MLRLIENDSVALLPEKAAGVGAKFSTQFRGFEGYIAIVGIQLTQQRGFPRLPGSCKANDGIVFP